MLKRLYISNFALINEMDVSFPGKLSVITGETGAGKSIFLEALGLVLGKRADAAALQNKSKKCVIEAEFETKGLDLASFFSENDIDNDAHIILRREISSEGKSRSFLNDTPVGLNVLKLLSEKIIDIHSQHQTLLLNQANFQLDIIDAFAGSSELYKNYRSDFSKLTKLNSELNQLQDQETQAKKELDYFQFLFNELEETEIKPGYLKELEDESSTLENAETIKSNLSAVSSAINGGDSNLLGAISQLRQKLQSISKYNSSYTQFYERLNSVYIELKELAADVEDAEGGVTFDPAKLDEINSKADKLNRLLKKHAVNSEEELLKAKQEIEEKLSQFNSLETKIEKTIKQIADLKKTCTKQANELTALRTKSVPVIEKNVKELLTELSMPNASFKIEISTLNELSSSGLDQVRLLFSANKGAPLNELHKVASGGELSRLMLTLKSLLATKKELPTIIFDEIDTGVSGDVADKIGIILSKMGKNMQVVTITHLPQIASKGGHHLFVYKKDDDEKTSSYIKELNKDERVTEIAKMLSTGNPTQSALKNAKELLNA
ncbi:MAG: recN [Bacteroidetes bacterium]|jgi:DNA repair protein RecN (Recombination protein N)|nr:recN [Bacteroidota bacterium]